MCRRIVEVEVACCKHVAATVVVLVAVEYFRISLQAALSNLLAPLFFSLVIIHSSVVLSIKLTNNNNYGSSCFRQRPC